MRSLNAIRTGLLLAAGVFFAVPAGAQMHHHATTPADSTKSPSASERMPGHGGMQGMQGHPGMHGHEMSGHGHTHMTGMYGPYPLTREASGTSWQPDRAWHRGIHEMKGRWNLMLHGMGDLVFDHQGGDRGGEKTFSSNMVMGLAQRGLGPGHLGLRAMLSGEPATIGKRGYPLLLQTGETADGRTPLIDRQHPHDLFMELAATYSIRSGRRSLFLYGGMPGEPALGPPAYMHRFSGMGIPEAPITHHWLDSSHITFGVLTGGLVLGQAKLEASAFRGREPDQNRYDLETPKLDSYSYRVSVNPSPSWSLQVSRGRLKSPEQLEPDVDTDRTTASAIYAKDWPAAHWESTIAWGQNRSRPGATLDALIAESALQLQGGHTVLARVERVKKNELFPEGDPRQGRIFNVGEASVGYRFDLLRGSHWAAGLGALGSIVMIPTDLRGAYGRNPASALLFTHVELR